MPAPPRPPTARTGRPLRVAAGVCALAVAAWLTAPAAGQPKPADAAVKLPDGTIVFFTKTPDEPNPPVEGVYLTPAEFKALVDQAEQLKKLKAAAKPAAPSGCAVRGKVEARGDRTVAALSLTFAVRTTVPRTAVLLGCQKGFPVAAKLDGAKLPVLAHGDDGLTVLIESPGEHTVAVDVDAPVAARGPGRELGFEIGLPRAAITTLALDPPAGAKKLTVGVRTAADRDLKQTTGDPAGGSRASVVMAARGSPSSNPSSRPGPRAATGTSTARAIVCSPGDSIRTVSPSSPWVSTGSLPSPSLAAAGNPFWHPSRTNVRGAVVRTANVSDRAATVRSPRASTLPRTVHALGAAGLTAALSFFSCSA